MIELAHPVKVQRFLRSAVEEVLGSTDPDGLARILLPPIRELFRAGADVDADPGSPRARQVMEVARAYRTLLRTEGLIDPAEALWEAAQASPDRRPVVVWGYPRLGSGELAFIDAVAGEGSIVRLPYGEDHTFDENLEAAEELKRRGWVIDRVPSQTVWRMEMPVEAHVYPHLEAEVRGVLAQVKVSPRGRRTARRHRGGGARRRLLRTNGALRGAGVRRTCAGPLPGTRFRHQGWVLARTSCSRRWSADSRSRSRPGSLHTPWAPASRAGAGLGRVRRTRRESRLGRRSGWTCRPWRGPRRTPARVGCTGSDELFEAYALDRKVRSWPREVVALSAAKTAVGWLGEPAAETISRERFVEEVEEVLRSTSTPAHPGREGVALHTPLSLYGARYRYVFTLGLTEGGFPPSVADDPALDFHERKRLRERGIRLELADERARRERLSFWTLLQVPQERLVLSYPKLVGGREALPSPYFGLVGVEPASPGPSACGQP